VQGRSPLLRANLCLPKSQTEHEHEQEHEDEDEDEDEDDAKPGAR
jgi:hypothetical protein